MFLQVWRDTNKLRRLSFFSGFLQNWNRYHRKWMTTECWMYFCVIFVYFSVKLPTSLSSLCLHETCVFIFSLVYLRIVILHQKQKLHVQTDRKLCRYSHRQINIISHKKSQLLFMRVSAIPQVKNQRFWCLLNLKAYYISRLRKHINTK